MKYLFIKLGTTAEVISVLMFIFLRKSTAFQLLELRSASNYESSRKLQSLETECLHMSLSRTNPYFARARIYDKLITN